jgi:hypothetical protein
MPIDDAPRPMPKTKVSLARVASPDRLAEVWKRQLRKRLRQTRLPDFELAHDALDYLHIDWDIEHIAHQLADDLMSGRYRAAPPEVIRCAKKIGLTRPLAFLTPLDQIVYKSIVLYAEPELYANSKPWTRYGRAEVRDRAATSPAESAGWFVAWIQRQRQLGNVVGQSPWLAQTDVANFYPSIQLRSLLDHVLAHSDLDEETVRVLGHMLRVFSHLPNYRVSATIGLPQENFECSRILAHTYLFEVDEAFTPEGLSGNYTRWVDDVVIGAASQEEALSHINRAQLALEKMGLYPNPAKTRVVPRAQFERELLPRVNAFLDRLDDRVKRGWAVNQTQFRQEIHRHLRAGPRDTSWVRVLRRFYTSARHLQDETLVRFADRHLQEFPDSARSILEYMANFRLTERRLARLVVAASGCAGLYEDVDLLLHEYICLAPNLDQLPLREHVGNWALEQLRGSFRANPRLAAASAMSLGKFGTPEQLIELKGLWRKTGQQTPLFVQGLVILKGAGLLAPYELMDALRRLGADTRGSYLKALGEGERVAVRIAFEQLKPRPRRNPPRYTVPVRPMFLSPWLREVDSLEWANKAAAWRKDLSNQAAAFADRAAFRWLLGH